MRINLPPERTAEHPWPADGCWCREVTGVDGKYNDGARKALNFLLYGCSGYDIAQSSKSDADLADVSYVRLCALPWHVIASKNHPCACPHKASAAQE